MVLPLPICHLLVRQRSDPVIVVLIATVIEAPGETVTEELPLTVTQLIVMDAWAEPAIKARPARMERRGIIRFIVPRGSPLSKGFRGRLLG